MGSYSEFRIAATDLASEPARTWTDFEDLSELVLVNTIRSEFLELETRFARAMSAAFRLTGAAYVDLCNVEPTHHSREARLRELGMWVTLATPLPDAVDLDELGPIVQALLRKQFWCLLASPGIEMSALEDMHVYVRSSFAEALLRPAIEHEGLRVDFAEYPHEYLALTRDLLRSILDSAERSPLSFDDLAALVAGAHPLADEETVRATCLYLAEQLCARRMLQPASRGQLFQKLSLWPHVNVEPWPGVIPERDTDDDAALRGAIDFHEFSSRLEALWPQDSSPDPTFCLVKTAFSM